MERDDLTKRYSFLFEKRGIGKAFRFVYDVYRSGKSVELLSFVIWELLHRAGLFPKKDYLTFNDEEVITLGDERLSSSTFGERLDHFFQRRQLSNLRSPHNWKLVFTTQTGEIFGCLYPEDTDLYRCANDDASPVFVHRFPERIKALYVSSRQTILVCVKGTVYRSSGSGRAFTKVLELGSPESFFRYNNAITELPDRTLVMGEYGNVWEANGWRNLAHLYFSSDDGETWKRSDFLKEQGTNKHVHIVQYSRLLNRLLVADGDNKKKLWLSKPLDSAGFEDPQWKAINRFHIQMGGYTAIAESDGQILFGTDYQGGTNFVVTTQDGKTLTKQIVPDPYRRSPIDNMVQRKSKRGVEIWANLPYSTANTKCLLMYTADGGKTWNKVIEYSHATHSVWLLNSSKEISDTLYYSIEDLRSHDRVVYKIVDQSDSLPNG
jgi:hypothetical protein